LRPFILCVYTWVHRTFGVTTPICSVTLQQPHYYGHIDTLPTQFNFQLWNRSINSKFCLHLCRLEQLVSLPSQHMQSRHHLLGFHQCFCSTFPYIDWQWIVWSGWQRRSVLLTKVRKISLNVWGSVSK
jgi:hypothetical protein